MFYLDCDGVSRDLHSFPTRRSSDLPRLHAIRLRTDRLVLFVPAGHALAKRRSAPLAALADQELVLRERGSITREVLRSEEHTSELQSHSDLVCRLLLEKKKGELQNQ